MLDGHISVEAPTMLVTRPTDWANIMRDRRIELGMSQSELAERIRMSRQWVVGFENGNAGVADLAVALRLANVLGVDTSLSARGGA